MSVNLGSVQFTEQTIDRRPEISTKVLLPKTAALALSVGDTVQMSAATHLLVAGDLTLRSYVVARDAAGADASALVFALGHLDMAGVKVAGVAITANQVQTLQEKSPIVLS